MNGRRRKTGAGGWQSSSRARRAWTARLSWRREAASAARLALTPLAAACALTAAPLGLAGQERVPGSLSLAEALEVAFRNNPNILAQRNDVGVADWNVRSAYGDWIPSASASSSVSWRGSGEERFGTITANQLGVTGQPSYLTSSYNLGLSFSVSGQKLFATGQAKRNRDAVQARVVAAENSLRRDVTKAYLAVLREIEARAVAEQELENAELNLRLAEGRMEVGSGNAIDVRQAEVNVGRARVTLLRSQAQVRTTRLRLLVVVGADLGAEPELETTFALAEPMWVAAELVELALAGNPDIRAAVADVASARYDVRSARSAYFPSLSISTGFSGFAQQASSTASQEARAVAAGEAAMRNCQAQNDLFSRLARPLPPRDCSGLGTPESVLAAIRAGNDAFPFDFTRSPPSVGMSISIPVFQGLSRQRGVESARAALSDSRHRRVQQELATRANVEAELELVRTSYATALIEEQNQSLADDQLRLARERYRLGFSNFLELAEAQTAKARADRERIYSVFAYHDAVADLEATVGAPLRTP